MLEALLEDILISVFDSTFYSGDPGSLEGIAEMCCSSIILFLFDR